MLQLSHHSQKYSRPVLSGSVPQTFAALYRSMGTVQEVREPIVECSRGLGDSGGVATLEEFSTQYLETRDSLALRRIRGEKLTAREQVLLESLNHLLEQLLPRPDRLPPDITELVEEVLRKR